MTSLLQGCVNEEAAGVFAMASDIRQALDDFAELYPVRLKEEKVSFGHD